MNKKTSQKLFMTNTIWCFFNVTLLYGILATCSETHDMNVHLNLKLNVNICGMAITTSIYMNHVCSKTFTVQSKNDAFDGHSWHISLKMSHICRKIRSRHFVVIVNSLISLTFYLLLDSKLNTWLRSCNEYLINADKNRTITSISVTKIEEFMHES